MSMPNNSLQENTDNVIETQNVDRTDHLSERKHNASERALMWGAMTAVHLSRFILEEGQHSHNAASKVVHGAVAALLAGKTYLSVREACSTHKDYSSHVAREEARQANRSAGLELT